VAAVHGLAVVSTHACLLAHKTTTLRSSGSRHVSSRAVSARLECDRASVALSSQEGFILHGFVGSLRSIGSMFCVHKLEKAADQIQFVLPLK
jgi:hypothetical protein